MAGEVIALVGSMIVLPAVAFWLGWHLVPRGAAGRLGDKPPEVRRRIRRTLAVILAALALELAVIIWAFSSSYTAVGIAVLAAAMLGPELIFRIRRARGT